MTTKLKIRSMSDSQIFYPTITSAVLNSSRNVSYKRCYLIVNKNATYTTVTCCGNQTVNGFPEVLRLFPNIHSPIQLNTSYCQYFLML